jgi:hypothetical protein
MEKMEQKRGKKYIVWENNAGYRTIGEDKRGFGEYFAW